MLGGINSVNFIVSIKTIAVHSNHSSCVPIAFSYNPPAPTSGEADGFSLYNIRPRSGSGASRSMLGSVRTPSPERAQGRDDDVFSAFSARASAGTAGAPAVPAGPPAVPAPGAPRKPRPRAARHRDIHRRVVRRLHSALEALAGAGAEGAEPGAEGAEPGATMSPEDALCGCTAAVEEAKKLARRFGAMARAPSYTLLSETLHLEAVRAEARVAEELERAAARAAAAVVGPAGAGDG